MNVDQLMRPFDPVQLAAELNIQNPIIIMMVEKWISIRRARLVFERDVASKVFKVKKEVTKFHSAMAKEQETDSEDDWEDEWVEDADEEVKQYELQGKPVSRSDIHNMLHFTSLVNIMED